MRGDQTVEKECISLRSILERAIFQVGREPKALTELSRKFEMEKGS